ncbi:hypothetical protein C479_10290 [Halovivax asiaticus JCM 14624]|uniref:DUF4129 domain-containing protein n=1 Tax=Halovivax asiaticus JCM 14624 TaxID=1227490 RepID=M0BGH6_9EURY|nr:hypothetical protein [Halovivax asiaticus]ELZ09955.1 hypothetical protein C479_10290 [Halovivax asiaticus JCM 14624]
MAFVVAPDEPYGSDDADELRSLTAAYEQAAFGPDAVDRSVAERTLSTAQALCDTDRSTSAPTEGNPTSDD